MQLAGIDRKDRGAKRSREQTPVAGRSTESRASSRRSSLSPEPEPASKRSRKSHDLVPVRINPIDVVLPVSIIITMSEVE